jgi:hypothetical protein
MAIIEGPGPPDGDTTEIMEIGRIPNLRPDIDQESRISIELKKRMGIVDLIPCHFKTNLIGAVKKGELSDAFKPNIVYEKPIALYKSQLRMYGLKEAEFIRVYLTDSTTVSETISNQYMKNVIDDSLNSLSSTKIGKLFKTVYNITSSTGQAKADTFDPTKTTDFVNDYSKAFNIVDDVLTHGTRIAFPKIWAGTDYSPQLTCNVKLVSPYGHPDAIARFIIRPLGYLMMMLSPRTAHGIVTKRPSFVALKSYGMSNLRIASPSAIEIRRGGDDNSYNQYKQPLSVEIALTFDALTEGFAAFDDSTAHDEMGIFSLNNDGALDLDGILTKKFDDEFETTPSALFPTMKSLVNSFRPFDYGTKTTTPDPPDDPDYPGDGLIPEGSIPTRGFNNPSSSGKESVDSFSEDVLMPSDTRSSTTSSTTTNTLLPPSILEHSNKSLSFTTD